MTERKIYKLVIENPDGSEGKIYQEKTNGGIRVLCTENVIYRGFVELSKEEAGELQDKLDEEQQQRTGRKATSIEDVATRISQVAEFVNAAANKDIW